jgi:hypothetical protein
MQAYPNAWFSVIYRPPNGAPRVVAPIVNAYNGVIDWEVPADVLKVPGDIALEFQARNGNQVVKASRWPFFVAASLTLAAGGGHCPPQPPSCTPPHLPPHGGENSNLDEILMAVSQGIIVSAQITEDQHLRFYTLGGEVLDAGELPVPETESGVASAPSKDALPEMGVMGVLYLVQGTDGKATLYTWNDDPPGYLPIQAACDCEGGTGGSSRPEQGMILDCTPVDD